MIRVPFDEQRALPEECFDLIAKSLSGESAATTQCVFRLEIVVKMKNHNVWNDEDDDNTDMHQIRLFDCLTQLPAWARQEHPGNGSGLHCQGASFNHVSFIWNTMFNPFCPMFNPFEAAGTTYGQCGNFGPQNGPNMASKAQFDILGDLPWTKIE